ncbi:MAG TPA: 50S ribosomal protein L32 [Candidatus Paceibacterota bacterium]|nr:50S ribosomal protein L32 [Candidatus Paceibacterota bacterium]
MRSTKGHTGNRRSHHALPEPRLTQCACGAMHVRHTACQACGMYRGKQVIDVVARTERTQRRTKRREQLLAELGMTSASEGGADEHDHSHDEQK